MPINQNNTLVCGKHACEAALNNPQRQCLKLLISNKKINTYKDFIDKYKDAINIVFLPEIELNQLIKDYTTHQGIILITRPLPSFSLEDITEKIKNKKFSTIIALDQVKDPRNIGAILRISAAFNIDFLLLPKDNTPSQTFSMAKTASGALDKIPLVIVSNLARSISYLKKQGYWCYGIEGKGEIGINTIKFNDKTLIILGSEEYGLRRLTLENCDYSVNIPISDQIESLNVASAAAIVLYQVALNHNFI